MERFVLDASIPLNWLLDEMTSERAMRVQKRMLSGARVVVPALWHLEIANVIIGNERRGALKRDLGGILEDLEQLSARLETVAVVTPVRTIVSLAVAHKLTSYDAEYLHLAQREALPLATLDKKLEAAARKAGIPLVT